MLCTSTNWDVISVASLNRMARDLLEKSFSSMWVGGEISNFTLAASGHAYFSLKDSRAQVRCVMFRTRITQLSFLPAEGMQVELRGGVTLYESRGDFQINVEQMRSAGLGRLYAAFEILKAKLQAEGLFNQDKKRAIPYFPAAIGIVTSPAAAALHDVISTLRRRMPLIPVILYPAQVQGEGSAKKIADAVRLAGERHEVDVLIVCRGGGSLEDLWAFNEEIVVRAVAESPIPTVSGVGHETDFTMCDFVADQRAPTPTAAAELVSPSCLHVHAQFEVKRCDLERALVRLLADKAQQLDYWANRLIHPGEKLQRQSTALQRQKDQLKLLLGGVFVRRRWELQLADNRRKSCRPDLPHVAKTLVLLQTRLKQALQELLSQQTQKLDILAATIVACNPESVLARGYAIVQKQDGSVVKASAELHTRERVRMLFAEGSREAVIDYPQDETQRSIEPLV